MKELSIEEKAKAYDEFLERVRSLSCSSEYEGYKKIFENIFPELAESEDERIRKEIVNVFKSLGDGKIPVSINYSNVFTWLEKQGEQKPVEWSEEDEKILKDILVDVKFEGYNNDMQAQSYRKIAWLKSLRPHKQWKPTEDNLDQAISILEKAAKDIKIPEKYKTFDWLCEKEDDFIENLHRQLRDNILRAKEEAKNKI